MTEAETMRRAIIAVKQGKTVAEAASHGLDGNVLKRQMDRDDRDDLAAWKHLGKKTLSYNVNVKPK